MNWFQSILKRAVSYWSDKLSWGGLLAGGTMANSGVLVTPDRALALTAYYAAINRIATDVASLPWCVYRRRRDGSRQILPDHPVSKLIRESPDGETTSMRWRQAYMAHVLGWGNGYAEIEFSKGGQPLGLYLLDPAGTAPERRPQDQVLYYRLSRQDMTKSGPTLSPHRVLHSAGLGYNGLKGYSVAQYHREAIGLGLAAERFGGAFFGNGSRPSGVLELPYKLKDKAAIDLLRHGWNTEYSGPDNAGKIAILEAGAKFHATSIPPEDAQFLQTRQFQVLEIARLFGIPPHKIGDYSSTGSAYRALEEANLDYLATTIRPWCVSIEQEFTRKLLTEDERARGFHIEHDMSAFLRGNSEARGRYYTTLLGLSMVTANDLCSMEGLNPIGEEGNRRYLTTSLQPLDQAGKAPAKTAPAEPDGDETPDPKTEPKP